MYISIAEAAEILKRGGIVAIPTETVYGLAGNAFDEKAIAKIFAAKERPFFDPLIAHIAEFGELESLAEEVPENARMLAEKFWPGPLTLVLKKRESVPGLMSGGLPTIAVRMPRKEIARDIIRLAGFPLAAPSANMFQRLSPTSAEHVHEQLGGRIDGIVDGGACEVGVESTVIGFEGGSPVIYRPGAITAEMLAGFCPIAASRSPAAKPLSPGMLDKHYSPDTPLSFWESGAPAPNSGLLAFGELPANASGFAKVLNLSEKSSPEEAAANLYRMLRELDSCGLGRIFAAKLPEKGLGIAVNDRLARAAAAASSKNIYITPIEKR